MPLSPEQEAEVIGRLPLFAGVPDIVIERLLMRRHPTAHREGEVIFQEGDPAGQFYIVLAGVVKIIRGRRGGAEVLLDLLQTGDTIAECSFCASDFHTFSAEAVTDTRLIGIDVGVISACLVENSALASVLLRVQQRHVDMMMKQVEQMKLMTNAQRVALFMLRFADRSGERAAFRLPHEKALIAQLLGMSAESFSRVLARLKGLGVLVDGREITITSVHKLRQLVENR